MTNPDRIVDLLTLAGVLALVALPVAVLVIGVLVWINRRRARAIKDWAARHGDLKRRLADVEALRRAEQGKVPVPGVYRDDQGSRCAVPPAGWDCTRAPGHDGPCAAIPAVKRPAHGGYPDAHPAIVAGPRGPEFQPSYIATMGDLEARN